MTAALEIRNAPNLDGCWEGCARPPLLIVAERSTASVKPV